MSSASSVSGLQVRHPAPRVAPHAARALGGIWRLTARRFFTVNYWLILAGMLAALVVISLPATSSQSRAAREFLPWAAGFYVCFLVPVLSFVSAAGTMRDDLAAGTVDYVFTRPVRRSWFIAFRYLTQVACTQIDFLFAVLVVIGLGFVCEVPGLAVMLPRLVLAQVLAITVFSAMGLLAGLLTSRYVIVGLVYGGLVEVGLGNVPTQLNQISLVRHLQSVLQPLLAEGEWRMTAGPATAALGLPASIGLLLLVAGALVGVAAIVFSWREFAGAGGRDA